MPEPDSRIRVILADDEPMGRASIKALLARDPDVVLIAECENGIEAVAAVRESRPDILFLDVQMPGMGGFEVVEELDDETGGDGPPVVVFATAYDEYALEAFEVHAVDYLLKPFDDQRFEIALGRAKERVRTENSSGAGTGLSELLETINTPLTREAPEGGFASRLTIHREGRIDVVDTEDLIWVEAADQYVMLHTGDGEFLMRESMGKLERNPRPGHLPPHPPLCHRGPRRGPRTRAPSGRRGTCRDSRWVLVARGPLPHGGSEGPPGLSQGPGPR